MSQTWNKADVALISSALFFLLALYLHLHLPSVIWTDGLLMVSEAALVGGVADWFAVTALFRRPLGFPYHTAILPRRRDSFIHAIVVMVQKEFFSEDLSSYRENPPISHAPRVSAQRSNRNENDGNRSSFYSCVIFAKKK